MDRVRRTRTLNTLGVLRPAIAGLSLLVAGSAQAITIGFDPDPVSAVVGERFEIDVIVSGLGGEVVSAYDIDLLYDSRVLDAKVVSVSAAQGLGPPIALFDADLDLAAGIVDVAAVSLLADAALQLLQEDSVPLFAVEFEAIGDGATEVRILLDEFNDIKGGDASPLDVAVDSGAVQVANPAVPEPTAAALFALGMTLAGRAMRRRHQRCTLGVLQHGS